MSALHRDRPGRRSALLLGAMLAAPATLRAQSRPVRLIVPYPPGGATDPVARLIAAGLPARLGQTVVVDNIGGAGGTIGSERVARAAPDGTTIGLGTNASHSIAPNLLNLSFDTVTGLTPISLLCELVSVLVVNPDDPARSVSDLVERARHGEPITFGSAGNGSSNQLGGTLLALRTGVQMQHIPYRGSGPAIADVMARRITFMFEVASSVLPHIEAGRLRALATTGAARHRLLPDTPTMAETLPDFVLPGWFALFGPPGLPPEIHGKLTAAVRNSVDDPETAGRLRQMGLDPLSSTPEDLQARVLRDRTFYAPIVRASGVRQD